jgi:hypothetical protein
MGFVAAVGASLFFPERVRSPGNPVIVSFRHGNTPSSPLAVPHAIILTERGLVALADSRLDLLRYPHIAIRSSGSLIRGERA